MYFKYSLDVSFNVQKQLFFVFDISSTKTVEGTLKKHKSSVEPFTIYMFLPFCFVFFTA